MAKTVVQKCPLTFVDWSDRASSTCNRDTYHCFADEKSKIVEVCTTPLWIEAGNLSPFFCFKEIILTLAVSHMECNKSQLKRILYAIIHFSFMQVKQIWEVIFFSLYMKSWTHLILRESLSCLHLSIAFCSHLTIEHITECFRNMFITFLIWSRYF